MQDTAETEGRARIVSALAATPSDISRGNASFAAYYAKNTGTKNWKQIVQASFAAYATRSNKGTQRTLSRQPQATGYVPRAIRGNIRRPGHPIVHTTVTVQHVHWQ
jgi:hypothetical protein